MNDNMTTMASVQPQTNSWIDRSALSKNSEVYKSKIKFSVIINTAKQCFDQDEPKLHSFTQMKKRNEHSQSV